MDGKYDDQCEVILNATDRLCNSMGNAAVMVKQARLLGQVGPDLALSNARRRIKFL